MAKMMTKSAIISHLAAKSNLTKKQVASLLEEFHALAVKEVKKAGFMVPGLGKLVVSSRRARMGRNPQTGGALKIAAKRVVRFRVAKAMRHAILAGPGPHGPGKGTPGAPLAGPGPHDYGKGKPPK